MVIPSTPPGFQILGCPVRNGGAECSRGCGGWNKKSTDYLTRLFLEGLLSFNTLCGPLSLRVEQTARDVSLQDGEYYALALLGTQYLIRFGAIHEAQASLGLHQTSPSV